MGNTIPVHCIPQCALDLIEAFCADLLIGSVCNDTLLGTFFHYGSYLLPSLQCSWQKAHGPRSRPFLRQLVLAPISPCAAAPDGPLVFIIKCQDSGQCLGAVSNRVDFNITTVNGAFVFDFKGNRGPNGYIVLRSGRVFHRANASFPPEGERIFSITEDHVLSVTWAVPHCVLQAYRHKENGIGPTLLLGTWPISAHMLIAAQFTAAPDHAVCVFQNMDVVLMSYGMEPRIVGRLFGEDSDPKMMAIECGTVLIKESEDQFVFVMVATMPAGCEDLKFIARFRVSPQFSVVDSWCSRSLGFRLGFVLTGANSETCLSEIVLENPAGSPLIAIHSHLQHHRPRVMLFDRKTLCFKGSRRLNHLTQYTYSGVGPIARYARDQGVGLVAKGIAQSKERRRRQTMD